MERHEVLEMMAALKLAGMRDAFDEVLADGLKRQHPMQRIIGELLKAEIADKQARSIKYQMSGAKLPLAKELADFDFTDTPVNEPLVRELAVGGFLANQRNAVLIGGTGTGKSHLAVAIARACIRDGARGRFFNVVDLVNHLEAEAPLRTPGPYSRTNSSDATSSSSTNSATCPSPRPAASCCSTSMSRLYERTSIIVTTNLDFRRMALRLRRPQDDHRAARPPDPPLRDHRDRKRLLALQESVLKATDPPAVGGDEKPRLDGDFSDIGHRGAVAGWFAGGSWLGAAVGK